MRVVTAALLAVALGCESPTESKGDEVFTFETAYSFPTLAASDFITTFDFDNGGALWVATNEGTIIRNRHGELTRFDAAAIVGAAQVHDLFIDGAGRPWVAGGGSVAVFENEAWRRVGPDDYFGLSAKVWQVAVNASGDILLAVGDADAGGLLLRRGGKWQAITPGNSALPSPLVLKIIVAPDGAFWVASAQFQGRGGLIRIAGDQITAVYDKARTGLLYNWIDDVAIGAGRIWLGFAVPIYELPEVAEGGIQSLPLAGGAPTTWYPFTTGLSSNRVASVTWSSSGELWFTTALDQDGNGCATCVAGIGVLRDGHFRILSQLNSTLAANEYLPQIREGPDGAIYVARGSEKTILKIVR